MIIEVVLILVGFVLLIKGADFLVDGACNIRIEAYYPMMV